MSDLLPPFHKVMFSALECHLANDRIAVLEGWETECKELRQAMRNLSGKYNELSVENERLRCCGNCDHNGGTHCCHPVVMESGEYIETGHAGRLDRCQVQGPDAPSLWEPARGLMVPARGPLFGDGVWERRQDNPPGLGLINDVVPPDRVSDE